MALNAEFDKLMSKINLAIKAEKHVFRVTIKGNYLIGSCLKRELAFLWHEAGTIQIETYSPIDSSDVKARLHKQWITMYWQQLLQIMHSVRSCIKMLLQDFDQTFNIDLGHATFGHDLLKWGTSPIQFVYQFVPDESATVTPYHRLKNMSTGLPIFAKVKKPAFAQCNKMF